MTEREFLTKVAEVIADKELANEATERIAKIDLKNQKRASKPSKTAIANAPLKEKIMEYYADHEGATAHEIANEIEVSTAKASSLLRSLVNEEKLKATKVRVARVNASGKKTNSVVNSYSKI